VNKLGLETKDLRNLVEAHGGACRVTLNLFLLKEGKVATELMGSEKLVVEQTGPEEENTEEMKDGKPKE